MSGQRCRYISKLVLLSTLTVTLIQVFLARDDVTVKVSKAPLKAIDERSPLSEISEIVTQFPNSSSVPACSTLRAERKSILYWNDFYGSHNFGFCCGRSPYLKHDCQCSNCFTSKDRTANVSSFDVIVFHGRELKKTDIPKTR